MIRGVSFKVPQKTTNLLCDILGSIDVSGYSWYCIKNQSEVWDETLEKDFFKKSFYSGIDFLKRIQTSHYIIFLKLQAYYQSHDFYEIQSYKNYKNSDCQIILLIYDCEYVEIYAKDTSISNSIFKKANELGYDNPQYITEDNDHRTKMSII